MTIRCNCLQTIFLDEIAILWFAFDRVLGDLLPNDFRRQPKSNGFGCLSLFFKTTLPHIIFIDQGITNVKKRSSGLACTSSFMTKAVRHMEIHAADGFGRLI